VPDRVGKMKPKEYITVQIEVSPNLRAMVNAHCDETSSRPYITP
jgi:hypothetical protein